MAALVQPVAGVDYYFDLDPVSGSVVRRPFQIPASSRPAKRLMKPGPAPEPPKFDATLLADDVRKDVEACREDAIVRQLKRCKDPVGETVGSACWRAQK